MIFPIGDDNVVGGHKPYISYGLIALNVIIYLVQFTTPGNLVCEYATIPNDILLGDNLHTGVTSMFLHGGWAHLLGNILYLWIFGDNIEACIGSTRFLIFYLFGGVVASLAHVFFGTGTGDMLNCCQICTVIDPCDITSPNIQPCPGSIPSLGASGAIAAVMGAYLVMFPKSRIKMIAIVFGVFYVPSFLFLLFWIGQQLFSGFGSLGALSSGGVAWWAHIGGFVFGLVMGWMYRGSAKMEH